MEQSPPPTPVRLLDENTKFHTKSQTCVINEDKGVWIILEPETEIYKSEIENHKS